MRYVLLFSTIFLMAAGQVLFKAASADPRLFLAPSFIAALGVYAVTTILWVLTLRHWPITAAYPATALSIVLVTLAAVTLFGERPSPQHWTGISIILLGLLVLLG